MHASTLRNPGTRTVRRSTGWHSFGMYHAVRYQARADNRDTAVQRQPDCDHGQVRGISASQQRVLSRFGVSSALRQESAAECGYRAPAPPAEVQYERC